MKKICEHKDFWKIYKVINFNKTFCEDKGREFDCSACGKKCNLKWKGYKKMKKDLVKRYFTYFLWMLPAIILIYLAFTQAISYISSIVLITVFHFAAMYWIIKSDRLVIKCK